MGVAKVTLNGTTLIDMTGKTVTSSSMLSGITALDKKGDNVTGNISSKSSTDLTVSGATVTAPAGYYANAASKTVATTTHSNPTASIASSTGVVTASHTQGTGYVTGGTTTGTLNLTTKAAATYNTSTADQTIASNRWLTGAQTIKSVTTSNLTAANIKSGVTVKVGDANNASRITQVTGTLKEGKAYTATIMGGSGNSSRCYVQYNGTKYYTNGQTFTFYAGDVLSFYLNSTNNQLGFGVGLYYEGSGPYSYSYTAIGCNIMIYMNSEASLSVIGINFFEDDNENYHPNLQLDDYYNAISDGDITPTTTEQIITPHSGYYGLANVTVNGDSNLVASNIKSGVSIFGISGTYSETPTYTATISGTGNSSYCYVQLNGGTKYYTSGGTFTFKAGDSLYCYTHNSGGVSQSIGVNGSVVKSGTTSANYTYTMPNKDIGIVLQYSGVGGISINESVVPNVYRSAYTYTPTTYNITIPRSTYLASSQTILGDSNLIASNIKSGVSIFGVSGTLEGVAPWMWSFITNNSSYYLSGSEFEAYCASLSIIYTGMFAHKYLDAYSSSYLTFTNCKTIQPVAFGFADINFPRNGKKYCVSFPEVTLIGSAAFHGDYELKSIIAQKCISISQSAFMSCESLTTISFPACTAIQSEAFAFCSSLQTASFSTCKNIGRSAFVNCYSLTTASFPVCTSIDTSAFRYCSKLTDIYFPSCLSVGPYAFMYCSSLVNVYLPSCTSIFNGAFSGCRALQNIELPECTYISAYVFAYCIALSTISIPKCVTIWSSAFSRCSALTEINLLSCDNIYSATFYGCSNLTTVSIHAANWISTTAFNNCFKLESVYLLKNSLISLGSTDVFNNTPMWTSTYTGKFGSIYVPSSLYSEYISATNWVTLSSRITSI